MYGNNQQMGGVTPSMMAQVAALRNRRMGMKMGAPPPGRPPMPSDPVGPGRGMPMDFGRGGMPPMAPGREMMPPMDPGRGMMPPPGGPIGMNAPQMGPMERGMPPGGPVSMPAPDMGGGMTMGGPSQTMPAPDMGGGMTMGGPGQLMPGNTPPGMGRGVPMPGQPGMPLNPAAAASALRARQQPRY